MRTAIILSVVSFAATIGGVGSVLVSCKKKQVTSIHDNMIQGSWRVSDYIDDGVVETDTWYGDTFVFSEGGPFSVSGVHIASGTWSAQREEGDADDSHTHLEFVLNVRGDVVDDLSEDWHVMDYSNTELKLIDKSGGNGVADYLTFTKN